MLTLNNCFAAEVNALDQAAFAALVAQCWHARCIGDDAFLLALDHAAPMQGPNHGWFQARLQRFAYVDRVVVAAAGQGRGLGRLLYQDLFTRAAARGLPLVACEVNLEPPNPGSMAFHQALGFSPLGEATDPRNGKRVRYLTRPLPPG